MQAAAGVSILNGVVTGPLRVYHRAEPSLTAVSALAPAEEWARFESARLAALKQLEALYRQALEAVGPKNAAIFQIHQMMLEDDDYLDPIKAIIEDRGATAEYAVAAIRLEFAATFAAMEDAYMRARAADVKDVSCRMVNILTGAAQPPILGRESVILAADELTPSEMIQLDRTKLLGFVTRDPSSDSHAAILARNMNIPGLMGVDFEDGWNGRPAVLDGYAGRLYIDPDAGLLDAAAEKRSLALIP